MIFLSDLQSCEKAHVEDVLDDSGYHLILIIRSYTCSNVYTRTAVLVNSIMLLYHRLSDCENMITFSIIFFISQRTCTIAV